MDEIQFMTMQVVNSFIGVNFMKENMLVKLSKEFAVDIVNLCTKVKDGRKGMR